MEVKSGEVIPVPKEVLEKLEKQIEVEVSYIVVDEQGRHGYAFKTKESALEYLIEQWRKEQELKSEFVFCPYCDRRLDIPRRLVEEHQEAVARLASIKHYLERDVAKIIRNDLTKRWYPDEKVSLEEARKIVKGIKDKVALLLQGRMFRDIKYLEFPDKRVKLERIDK